MNYVNLPGYGPVSVYDACAAHQQLEADYNNGGWLRERPSNQRRREATSCQLSRMGYSDVYRWVDICGADDDFDDPADNDVRWIYLSNVMKWGLPADQEMRDAIRRRFTLDFLEREYPAYLEREPA